MSAASSRAIRAIGSAVLWALALVGVASAGLWAANAAGLVQPLIVVSGSMSPGIGTGDLLFATKTPVADVEVGEVITLPSTVTGKLVTHRVIEVAAVAGGSEIRMQGDANAHPDGETYFVAAGTSVWQPVWTIPGAGRVVTTLMRPQVALPGAIGIFALVALTMLPARRTDPEEGEDAAGPTVDKVLTS